MSCKWPEHGFQKTHPALFFRLPHGQGVPFSGTRGTAELTGLIIDLYSQVDRNPIRFRAPIFTSVSCPSSAPTVTYSQSSLSSDDTDLVFESDSGPCSSSIFTSPRP